MSERLTHRGAIVAAGVLSVAGQARAAMPAIALTPFGFIVDFLEMMNASSGGHFAAAGPDAQVLGAGGAAAAMGQLAAGR